MGRIAFHVINLDGSADRLDAITRQIEGLGVAFHRVPAFDGRGQDVRSLPRYDDAASRRFMGRSLRGGEVGCFLSHRAAAEMFLQGDAEFGVVLEDDSQLLGDVHAVILGLTAQMPDGWDVANLGNAKLKTETFLRDVAGHSVHAGHYFPMTTTALLWTRGGAEAFLQASETICAPVDNFLRRWQAQRGRGLVVVPAIVKPTGAPSEIHSASLPGSSAWGLGYALRKRRRLITDLILARRAQISFRKRLNSAK